MFNVTIEDLEDFDRMVGFWGGAKDVWGSLTDEQKEYLNEVAEGFEFASLTQVNDFVWFDAPDILEEENNDGRKDKED